MALRGSNKLFTEIFNAPETQPSTTQRRGRSADLVARRNECLIDRYFWIGDTTGAKYEKLIQQLSSEFFISGMTIHDIMQKHIDQLVRLKKTKPGKKYFAERWPHLSW